MRMTRKVIPVLFMNILVWVNNESCQNPVFRVMTTEVNEKTQKQHGGAARKINTLFSGKKIRKLNESPDSWKYRYPDKIVLEGIHQGNPEWIPIEFRYRKNDEEQ